MRKILLSLSIVCVILLAIACRQVQEYNAHRFDKEIITAQKLLNHEEVRLKDLNDLDDKFPYEEFRKKLMSIGMTKEQIQFLCCSPNRYVRMR